MIKLNLEVGQAWKIRRGGIVVVYGRIDRPGNENHYRVTEQGWGREWIVREDGTSVNHGSDVADLVQRVQRVYIAGPMSGYPDLNFPAFRSAAAEYRHRGCLVTDPSTLNGGIDEIGECARMDPAQYRDHWCKCMKRDINALMDCDMIVMLSGWEKSKGAKLEHHIAQQLGLTISYPVDTYGENLKHG